MRVDKGSIDPERMGGGILDLFKRLRGDMDVLALWAISLTWISHFKLEEIVTPSNLKEDLEISEGIGLMKRGEVLRKHIGIIIDLEGFTLMFKTAASSVLSLRLLIGLLTKFR